MRFRLWRSKLRQNIPRSILVSLQTLATDTHAAAAGFKDSSLWEEAKKKSDDAVKKLIDDGLNGTTVTVVCIGSETAGRKFINYEIQKSIDRGNGIVGIQIHHLKNFSGRTDPVGRTPGLLTRNGYPVYKYVDHATLKTRVEEAAAAAGK